MRKKKPKTTATLPIIQQDILVASSVAPVALLIDGENTIVPDLIAQILVEAGNMGGVTIRQVYGNWAAPSMQPWKETMTYYGLEPIGNGQKNTGRNATDIALVIGAMDLLHRGFRHFCLVAGDSDYVPLVFRLRQSECIVLGIGLPSASHALKDACSRFLTTGQLVPHVASSISPPTPSVESLTSLLTSAYLLNANKSEKEWIPLAALGVTLRDLNPHFQEIYGKQSLSAMINQYPDLFEVRQRETEKGHTDEVRLRKQSR